MLFTKDYSQLLLIPEGKEGAASLPDQSTLVSATAFSRCSVLSQILVGDSATYTSYDGVLYSKDLKTLVACPAGIGASIVIPAETETIDKDALAGCKDLASITALGNIQKIDPTAFSNETKATAVVALPAGQDYDSRKATWEQAGFENFAEPAKPGETTNQDTNEATGLTYTLLDDYTLAVSWQGKDDPEANLEIPASAEINGVPYRVSTIAENAFANRGSLTSVKLPSSITTINNGAFAGCANLAIIEFPNTLRTIGERAFEATSLKDIWLPNSINSIGSRVFASCSTLERVVALGTLEVASDAFAGCTGISIYVPSHSEDTWNPGIPSDNNHLLPYGVSLAKEPLTIEAGQEANLLEGGNLQAPDPVEVSYSYAASPVSIDAGRVSTKKAGTSDVTAVLSLDGIELTRATRTVEVSPNPEGEPDIAILNSEVPLPAAYLADARETQLDVVAPISVTFGEEAPYDVAEGMAPASMESTADFKNNMDVPVQLAKIECTPQDLGLTLVPIGATPVFNQKLFSLYPAGEGGEEKAVHFGCNSPLNSVSPDIPSDFTIQPKSTSSFVFRLNLTNDTTNLANAKVIYDIASNGVRTRNIATVKYTFELSSFYLEDNADHFYTLADIKRHAEDIARNDKESSYYSQYEGYLKDDSTYTCKTIWDGTPYDVRIIGINHDEKEDGNKAGLTFQFVNLFNGSFLMNPYVHDSGGGAYDNNTGGWGKSELRAQMNPDNLPNADGVIINNYGSDNNEIWRLVPTDLQQSIEVVKKKYQSNWNGSTSTIKTSNDKLFLASYSELVESSYWGRTHWTVQEGTQYAYWYGKVTQNNGKNNCLRKRKQQESPNNYFVWWERTVRPGMDGYFNYVNDTGSPNVSNGASWSYGICPCFCF